MFDSDHDHVQWIENEHKGRYKEKELKNGQQQPSDKQKRDNIKRKRKAQSHFCCAYGLRVCVIVYQVYCCVAILRGV